MNLKDLKYLVALADTGHFGKAAARTFVSQPTLSAQLKKLEEYLGVKLVERQPKNVQLTDVGRQVVVRARRMLEDGDEIVALARNNTDPLAGKLRVGLIPTIGPYLLPRVMPKLRKALPQLHLMLYEYQTESLLKRLRDGEIDTGIMALPGPSDGMDFQELYREAFTVALPIGHPLAEKSAIKVAGSQGPDAATPRGRPLPARSGAGGLQPHRRQGGRGFSRHEPGDPAANGRRRARHHAAAGTGGRCAVRLAEGPCGAAVRQAGADPYGRSGLAEVEHTLRSPSPSCARSVHSTMARN